MLTLYGETLWESPYVYSVFVALREKGLAFDLKELDLQAGEQRQQPFAERSMVAKVPALDHDGFWLTESLAIVEYLDERFPSPEHPPVMPYGIEERARARQLAGVLRSGLPHLVAERPTSSIVFDPMRTPLGDAARADAAKLINMVERLLPSDSTALFSHWTFIDAELALALHRLLASGDPVPARVRAYAEAIWQRPSVRAYIQHERLRS